MRRRQSVFMRGNRRHPAIDDAARLSHLMQIRSGDSLKGLISSSKAGMPANVAGDVFTVANTIDVRNTCSVTGVGYSSELRLVDSGPVLNITANDVVIENIRFVYQGGLTSTTLVTRPERCSGSSYTPTDLTPTTTYSAVVISGDNVTIRNCWFDGFDNAIYSTGDNTSIKGCYFKGQSTTTKSAIYLTGSYANVWQCYVEATAYGVYLTGSYASISDNNLQGTESGAFVTGDYNRIHGNYCIGAATGFAMVLTDAAQSNAVTGNVARVGTYKFSSPATTNNQYGANIGTVDI